MKTPGPMIPKADDEPHYLIIHNPYPPPRGMQDKRWDNASKRAVCQWLCSFVPAQSILCLYTRQRPNSIVLIELSHTVDISKILGAHYWCTFDGSHPLTSTQKSSIFRCKYDTYEEAVSKPAWEPGAIDSAALENLTPLPNLRDVIYPKPRPIKLHEVFGIGDASYAMENPPPPEGEKVEPLRPPEYISRPPPPAQPQRDARFRNPRYQEPPFQPGRQGPENRPGPSRPPADRGRRPGYPSSSSQGFGRGGRSMPGTPGNVTPAYTPTSQQWDNQTVPQAFPRWQPPSAAGPSPPSSTGGRTPAYTGANTGAGPSSPPRDPPFASQPSALGSASPPQAAGPNTNTNTLNRNTADLRNRQAAPSVRDPRLRPQAAPSTPNTATSSTTVPSMTVPGQPTAENASPPTPATVPERARSVTPFVRNLASSTPSSAVAARLAPRRGLFGMPGGPPPSAEQRAEIASPGPDTLSERGGSTVSSSFPTPPPPQVKIEELLPDPESVQAEEDVKPVILPSGEAVDPRTLARQTRIGQIKQEEMVGQRSPAPSAASVQVKSEPGAPRLVKKEEPSEIIVMKEEDGGGRVRLKKEEPRDIVLLKNESDGPMGSTPSMHAPAVKPEPIPFPQGMRRIRSPDPVAVKEEPTNHQYSQPRSGTSQGTRASTVSLDDDLPDYEETMVANRWNIKRESSSDSTMRGTAESSETDGEDMPTPKAKVSSDPFLKSEPGSEPQTGHVGFAHPPIMPTYEEHSADAKMAGLGGRTGAVAWEQEEKKPVPKPDSQAISSVDEWLKVHWDLRDEVTAGDPSSEQDLLSWLREEGEDGGGYDVEWDTYIDVGFEIVSVATDDDDMTRRIREERVKKEADDLLEQLSMDLGMNKRKLEPEEHDFLASKRMRTGESSME